MAKVIYRFEAYIRQVNIYQNNNNTFGQFFIVTQYMFIMIIHVKNHQYENIQYDFIQIWLVVTRKILWLFKRVNINFITIYHLCLYSAADIQKKANDSTSYIRIFIVNSQNQLVVTWWYLYMMLSIILALKWYITWVYTASLFRMTVIFQHFQYIDI